VGAEALRITTGSSGAQLQALFAELAARARMTPARISRSVVFHDASGPPECMIVDPSYPIVHDSRKTGGVPRLTGVVSIGVHRLIASLAVASGVSSLFALTACAPMMSMAGSSGSGVFLATQFDRLKLLADGFSYAQTGKTLSDRAVSNVAGADCSTFNVAMGKPVCSSSGPRAAPVEERDRSVAFNAEAQRSTSAGVAISSQQASVPDALRATPLLAIQTGEIERFDCTSGTPTWHARIAFEAQGGQVLGFAYYSIWKPRTCSIEFMRDTVGSKWIAAPDGTDHVDTAQGRFVIRTSADAYVFEFQNVQRGKFCGMPGEINGTMMIKRDPARPHCSVVGIMDTNDPYLEALYGSAPVKGQAARR
jgi:hypothetical protein